MKINNIWNKGKIENLKLSTANAQSKIVKLIVESAIKINDDYYGWGQFLSQEKVDDQFGIYGTSAAIQILTLAGYSNDNEYVSKACKLIEDYSSDNSSRFNKKEDLTVLYKIIYLFNVCRICGKSSNDDFSNTLYKNIIESVLEEKGWGYFCNLSTGERDALPRITTTALTMLSLKYSLEFVNSELCKKILKWLYSSFQSDPDLKIYDASLCTMVFIEYSNLIIFDESDDIIKDCYARLKKISDTRGKDDFYDTENHHFHFILSHERMNKYMFFLPDCLIAQAFLLKQKEIINKRYILRVAKFYTEEIIKNDGFAPHSTRNFSTLDHLWIYIFLESLKRTDSRKLIPNGISKYLSKPIYFYFGLIVLLLTIGFYAYSSSSLGALKLVFLVLAYGILSIGWNLIAAWIERTLLNKS